MIMYNYIKIFTRVSEKNRTTRTQIKDKDSLIQNL